MPSQSPGWKVSLKEKIDTFFKDNEQDEEDFIYELMTLIHKSKGPRPQGQQNSPGSVNANNCS